MKTISLHLRRLNESDRARLLSYVENPESLRRKADNLRSAIADLWHCEGFGWRLSDGNEEWVRSIYKSVTENKYEKIINDVAKKT